MESSIKVPLTSLKCSDKTTDNPDYKWLRVITSDCEWLRARLRVTASGDKWLRVTTSQIANQTRRDYKWLEVTTNDYKRLRVKLRMTITATSNNLRHKNFYRFLWLHNIESSKYVGKCYTFVIHFWWKSLKSTCAAEADVLQSKYS